MLQKTVLSISEYPGYSLGKLLMCLEYACITKCLDVISLTSNILSDSSHPQLPFSCSLDALQSSILAFAASPLTLTLWPVHGLCRVSICIRSLVHSVEHHKAACFSCPLIHLFFCPWAWWLINHLRNINESQELLMVSFRYQVLTQAPSFHHSRNCNN